MAGPGGEVEEWEGMGRKGFGRVRGEAAEAL